MSPQKHCSSGFQKGQSHPSRVRGLKRFLMLYARITVRVAPFTGAWIETLEVYSVSFESLVAPLAGAWIET